MMQALLDWVRSLLLVGFTVTLVHMVLPDNTLRPYMRLVFGLVLLGVMIRPLIGIVDNTDLWQRDLGELFRIPEVTTSQEWVMRGREIEQRGVDVAFDQLTSRLGQQIEVMVSLLDQVRRAQVKDLEITDSGIGRLVIVVHADEDAESQVKELLMKYFGIPGGSVEIEWVLEEGA